MDQGEEEISWGENVKCIGKVTAWNWQITIGNIFTFGHNIWQVLNVSNIHGLVLVTENVPKWRKIEQNVGYLTIWEWIDMDQLQWWNGLIVGRIKSYYWGKDILWGGYLSKAGIKKEEVLRYGDYG